MQGLVVNCGGIVAYYPSRVALHPWAPGVGERDLFGEIVAAAREEGLAVLARMDTSRAAPAVRRERPEWFCVDAEGRPLMRGDKHLTCLNGGYHDELVPEVLAEVVERYGPEGFADNGWSGPGRSQVCQCDACARRFHAWSHGRALPRTPDWSSEAYREWVRWGYVRRTELWDANDAVTRAAGGPSCRWIGMLHGRLTRNAESLQDVAALVGRTPLVLLDHQGRAPGEGFAANAEAARRLRGLLGSAGTVVESTAMYDLGHPVFRLSSMPAAEVELWTAHGFAGGTHPWWHHVGGVHEDRRQLETAVGPFGWHAEHVDLLLDREPVADVGVVWSQENLDLHGRDDAQNLVVSPYTGITTVLDRAQLLSVPVHVDQVDDARVRVLVLPEVAVLSDEQCASVRRFVERGGALLATGATSLRDETGTPRPDLGLADVLGVRLTGEAHGDVGPPPRSIERWERHSYLRLPDDVEHPALAGLSATRTISFGGALRGVRADPDREVLLTWVPPFPVFPPETSWMATQRTDVPALVVGQRPGQGRVAYLAADLDRCSDRDEQPDHATVLASTLRWLLGRPTVKVEGGAPVGVHLYRNEAGCVVHLTSLLTTTATPGRTSAAPPVGPVTVRVRTGDRALPVVRRHVGAGRLEVSAGTDDDPPGGCWTRFSVDSLTVHEVLSLVEEAR